MVSAINAFTDLEYSCQTPGNTWCNRILSFCYRRLSLATPKIWSELCWYP
jgi:hypothetical protein